jgi:hypothetical protein
MVTYSNSPAEPGDWQDHGGASQPPEFGSPISPHPEPMLVTIGDIGVTPSTVVTPSGTRPVGKVQWMFTDMSRTTEAIPTWAIVCTVIFFLFCLLGLLFLLVKENRTEGHVQVVVQGSGFVHTTQLPVSSIAQVADYNARVNYARSVSAAASGSTH